MLRKALQSAVLVTSLSVSGFAMADAISINFENIPTGPVPGGSDARTPGNATTFYDPDNSATSGVVTSGIGVGGSTGLVVGNRGNGNDGVIENVLTPRLGQAAGETSTGAPNKFFQSSYDFRTAATSSVANFAFKSETWGQTDRDSYIGFFDNGAGGLTVVVYDIEQVSPGKYDFVEHDATTQLAYGTWYHVVTQIQYVDGPDNDVLNQFVYDSNGNLLVSFTGLQTWEDGQENSVGVMPPYDAPYNGGALVAADSIDFQSRLSPSGADGSVDIDNVSLFSGSAFPAAVPEPEEGLLVAIGFVGLLAVRRRRGSR